MEEFLYALPVVTTRRNLSRLASIIGCFDSASNHSDKYRFSTGTTVPEMVETYVALLNTLDLVQIHLHAIRFCSFIHKRCNAYECEISFLKI